MFILITPEGEAYHRTNGMPSIFRDMDEVEAAATWPFRIENWAALELSNEESWHFYDQAYLAVYGRRSDVGR